MDDIEPRSRRRGVQASRIKLNKALADAGLKTQAALAQRIADIENTDAVPKDLVNRVFRQQTVDLQTLERVARGLGVKAYSLYLTSSDTPVEPESRLETGPTVPDVPAVVSIQETAQPLRSPKSLRPLYAWLVAVLGIGLVLAALGRPQFSKRQPENQTTSAAKPLVPQFGRFKAVVTSIRGDTSGDLSVALVEQLQRTVGVPSPAVQQLIAAESPGDAARRMRSDLIIDGEIVEVGQLRAVRIYAYALTRAHRELVWSESFPSGASSRRTQEVARHASDAVNRMLGLTTGSMAKMHFPPITAQDEYLQGRLFADKAHSEINLRRAQGHFEAALRHDSDYAAAHAGLCVATLDAIWADDEKRQLENAEKSCARAVQLDPDDSETLRAQAWFLNRSGRARDAVDMYTRAVTAEPADMEAALGLANSEFDLYRITGDQAWGLRSLEHAKLATTLTPTLAKPHMWLATYQWHVISVNAAMDALQKAYALDPQDQIVAVNLGSAYLCRGDFERARDLYVKAREASPGSFTGNEFLGSIYYYLRDYDQSARLRQTAVDTAGSGGGGEIHQMWGDLGDSYRRTGDDGKAMKAYEHALEIVERDFLLGNGSLGDKAWRAYYYARLSALTGREPPSAVVRTLDSDLDEAYNKAAEPSAFLRAALAWELRKNPEKANLALRKASAHCPGYSKHPDVSGL